MSLRKSIKFIFWNIVALLFLLAMLTSMINAIQQNYDVASLFAVIALWMRFECFAEFKV